MSDDVELKPCPFCGSPGEIEEAEASQAAGPGSVYRGNCAEYGCANMVWTTVYQEAVAAWNTRAALTASRSSNDEIVEVLENAVHALESWNVSPVGGLPKIRALLSKVKEG